MMPALLQSHPSVCGFYTINATFHLFKFRQEKITGVHDVSCEFLNRILKILLTPYLIPFLQEE